MRKRLAIAIAIVAMVTGHSVQPATAVDGCTIAAGAVGPVQWNAQVNKLYANVTVSCVNATVLYVQGTLIDASTSQIHDAIYNAWSGGTVFQESKECVQSASSYQYYVEEVYVAFQVTGGGEAWSYPLRDNKDYQPNFINCEVTNISP